LSEFNYIFQEKYKRLFRVSYKGPEEESKHFDIFHQNLLEVRKMNDLAHGASVHEMYEFMDLNEEEYQMKRPSLRRIDHERIATRSGFFLFSNDNHI